MPRQVVLFTPGDSERMVNKALSSGADMVILDIEDAVAPVAKDSACEIIKNTLRDTPTSEIEVEIAVRINSLATRGAEDLSKIAPASDKIKEIVIPKVRTGEDINRLEELMADTGHTAGISPIIETPKAVLNIEDITTHPDVDAIEFGAEDYTTEIGALDTYERIEIQYARQKIVTAANSAEIDAIDMAWPDFDDEKGLRQNSEDAVNFGYDGKSAIHPVQIEVIREVFTPTASKTEWAENVVAGAKEAEKEGKVTFQLDGEMIDPPIIDRARDILERTNTANPSE